MSREPQGIDDIQPGEVWNIDSDRFDPSLDVPDWAYEMLTIYSACRGENGLAFLPEAGGLYDQVGVMIDGLNSVAGYMGEYTSRLLRQKTGKA